MVKGFEGLETATVEEVNAMKEMEKAKVEIQEREERKAITKGADGGPVAPKMNINVRHSRLWSVPISLTVFCNQASKLSGRARSRHQLSTLLNEAYTNREALEEKIAEGRRNRKEAGNKYGKHSSDTSPAVDLEPPVQVSSGFCLYYRLYQYRLKSPRGNTLRFLDGITNKTITLLTQLQLCLSSQQLHLRQHTKV